MRRERDAVLAAVAIGGRTVDFDPPRRQLAAWSGRRPSAGASWVSSTKSASPSAGDDGVDVELEEREEGAARAPGFAGVLLVQGRIAAALSVASRGLFGAVSAALHGDTGYVEPMFQTMLDGLRPLAGR